MSTHGVVCQRGDYPCVSPPGAAVNSPGRGIRGTPAPNTPALVGTSVAHFFRDRDSTAVYASCRTRGSRSCFSCSSVWITGNVSARI
jgi:hypothetical protein